MKREIKFRAYHIESNRMFEVYGFNREFVFENRTDYIGLNTNVFPIEDCVLMQYIGDEDGKGIEIYEGDIVVSVFDDSNVNSSIVEYVNLEFMRRLIATNIYYSFKKNYFYKIIGNIYLNPELLTQ